MTPVLGYVSDERTIYTAGCMGHGMALAILNGQTISDMIGGQHTELTDSFFVGRPVLPLPPEPLRTPLANGILGVMRAQDTFDERHGLGVPR
jgi:glycine/D-amino acid oxidase-like deaminating enzyme